MAIGEGKHRAIGEGKHRAKAKAWALGETGTGKEQIGICFDFLDLPGEEMTWYGFFTDGTLERTIKSMRTCGWQGSDLTELDTLGTNEVTLVVEEEEYPEGSGEFTLKVQWINGTGGLAMKKALDEGGIKSFAARMKAQILAVDPATASQHAKKPAAKKPAPRQAAPDDAPPHGDADGPPF